MKIIAFSDIHGNQYAFHEFVKQIKTIAYDYLFFCGDIHGYYYGQSSIVRRMGQLEHLYAVKGNHDQMAIDIADGRQAAEQYFEKYGHSYEMLTYDNIQFVRNLPELIELDVDGKKCVILHGTLDDRLNGRMYPKDQVKKGELYQAYDYVFCGHTHFQMIKKCGRATIINAGSLGQQRDGKGFCFVYVDTQSWQVEYRQIRYDMSKLETEVRKYDPDNEKMITILHRGEE